MKEWKIEQLKKIVAESYEIAGEHFAATRAKAPAEDFLWASKQLLPTGVVLDAGCGNGRLLDCQNISPDRYLGIDNSKTLIDIALRSHVGYNFQVGNLLESNLLPQDKFSSIFCSAVIGHIPGKEERAKVLRSLLSSCKSDGRLIISYWKFRGKYRRELWQTWLKKITGRHLYGWFDFVFPWKNDDGKEIAHRYYHLFSPSSFNREIEAAGWKVIMANNSGYNYWIVAEKR